MRYGNLIIVFLFLTVGILSAQKKNIGKLKAAGDENYRLFTEKADSLFGEDIIGISVDENVVYDALLNVYYNYFEIIKAAPKNKYNAEIAANLKSIHLYYTSAGVYYYDNKDYSKASDAFAMYWMIPALKIFKEEDFQSITEDSNFQTIKYYAAICAIQAEDSRRAIGLLNKIISEPFIKNETYTENEVYELLASEYEKAGDRSNLIATLEKGVKLFPSNVYFLHNLISQYIVEKQRDKAIEYIDKAIVENGENICDLYRIKASLYLIDKDYGTAEEIYKFSLNMNKNCDRSLEELALLYILKAQDLKDEAASLPQSDKRKSLDEQAESFYLKSVPLLEKYKDLLLSSKDTDKNKLRSIYMKLANVYYNLNDDANYEKANSDKENLDM